MQIFFKTTITSSKLYTSLFRAAKTVSALKIANTLEASLKSAIVEFVKIDDNQHSTLISLLQQVDITNGKKALEVLVVKSDLMEKNKVIIPEHRMVVYEGDSTEKILLEITTILDQLTGKMAIVSETIQ